MTTTQKSLLAIFGLILATTLSLATMGTMDAAPVPETPDNRALAVSSEVVQGKVVKGGDGQVTVALTMTAPRLPSLDKRRAQAADLVVVLDRSGSMNGQKLDDARQALIDLLDKVGPDDRMALVTYSNSVQVQSALIPMTERNRRRLASAIKRIHAGGGTNLGGGLNQGMDMLMNTPGAERQRKVILISDGLANHGITDPAELGRLASAAVENRFYISTVGVGLDFNEVLMTAIADQGAGQYHFLEDPGVFTRVFEDEFLATRHVTAADVEIRIPVGPGVRLKSAGGYPIRHEKNTAVIRPGNLLSGQGRTLYLTFSVPTEVEKEIVLGSVQVKYQQNGHERFLDTSGPLTVACVADPVAVLGSINKKSWADQVVQEEFSRLKEEVADDIRDGDKSRAEARIREYEDKQTAINATVGSSRVAQNLETDVKVLHQRVDETFAGEPAAVAKKRKQAAKSLQYDSYQIRRDKN